MSTEWGSAELDLDAYLRRISYAGDLRPDERTLAALHRAHVAAIPFENLDIMLGRGVEVDLPSVQAKLVGQRRGGYCYEHGMLFGAALERLGYPVDRFLARTGDPVEHPRPRTHMVLRVAVGDRPWLADVGFGSGLLEPLPMETTGAVRQGGWSYRLVAGDDRTWRLRELQGADWVTLQTFTAEPLYWVDVAVANYNTATHPDSPFTQRPIVVRKDDHTVRSLIGREFSVTTPDRSVRRRDLADDEFAPVLRAEFGVVLTPAEVATIVATVPNPLEVAR